MDYPLYETRTVDDYSDRHDVHLVECTRKIVYITAHNRQLSSYQGVDWIRIVCDEVLYKQSSVTIRVCLVCWLLQIQSTIATYTAMKVGM